MGKSYEEYFDEQSEGTWFVITQETKCFYTDTQISLAMKTNFNESICRDDDFKRMEINHCMPLVLKSHCGFSLSYYS